MPIWKLTAILLAIFLTGLVTGAFTAIPLIRKDVEQRITSEQIAPRQVRRISRALDLTPEQLKTVEPIVQQYSEELRKARAEAHRAAAAIIETMEAKIAQNITPGQQQLLAKMQSEERERARQMFENQNRPKQPGPGNKQPGGGPDKKPSPPKQPGAPAKPKQPKPEQPITFTQTTGKDAGRTIELTPEQLTRILNANDPKKPAPRSPQQLQPRPDKKPPAKQPQPPPAD